MESISGLIRRSPVVAFYVICFGISWLLWLPLILSHSDISELLAMIGLFGGPALACLIVARISSPPAARERPIPFWLALLLAWIACTAVFILYQRRSMPNMTLPAVAIFAIFAFIPAFVLASAVSGPSGVRRTLSSLARPRGWWGWYLLALLIPAAARLASVWLNELLGWEVLYRPIVPADPVTAASSILLIFLYTMLYAGGLNEETGWSGLALPRLQAQVNPIVATIIVWALWMLWHVPLHYAGLFDMSAHVLIGSFFGRFLLTYLFIRSKGGIWTAILLHTSVNVTSQFVLVSNASLLVDALLAILVIFGGRMWQRLPADSPAILAGDPLSER